MKDEKITEGPKYTGRQRCEHIVKTDILAYPNGEKPTWEQIWNYSPTGELFMIQLWFEAACEKIGPPLTGEELTIK